jgi:hypothetical protein
MATTPLFGSWVVEVLGVRPFEIHGDRYYEIAVTQPGQGAPVTLRVPQHATAGEPRAGETLKVQFLMGQVTSAKPG